MDKFDRRSFIQASAATAAGALTTQSASAAAPGLATNAPPADMPGVEFAMIVAAKIDPVISMGKTPLGERRVITISGGTFEGPRLRGTIMPGGEDWQVVRSDGVTVFEARYWLKTDDGAIIKVLNRALRVPGKEPGKDYVRTSPEFEAPVGPHDWLNKALFVGTLAVDNPAKPQTVFLRFYRVT